MRIFLLTDGKNPHSIKWVRSLAVQGVDVFVFSLASFDESLYSNFPNVTCYSANRKLAGNKLSYLTTLKTLKVKIKEFRPSVLHAHYASSYGLLGALSGFKPFFISVWGMDVFEFPKRSFIHRLVLKFSLSRAQKLFSTSHMMAKETQQYTDKPIQVIPFGVDMDIFKPATQLSANEIVVGTVKTLEPKYGMDILVKAFAEVYRRHDNLRLVIVGRGYLLDELVSLAQGLGISHVTKFVGWIPVEQVPSYHNSFDIAVFPSVCSSESFGVAAVEACSSEKPVIVSRIGGLTEVVAENETGLIVPPGDVAALSQAIERLVTDPALRVRLGKQGRKRVAELYNWKENLSTMLESYKQVETNTWN